MDSFIEISSPDAHTDEMSSVLKMRALCCNVCYLLLCNCKSFVRLNTLLIIQVVSGKILATKRTVFIKLYMINLFLLLLFLSLFFCGCNINMLIKFELNQVTNQGSLHSGLLCFSQNVNCTKQKAQSQILAQIIKNNKML